MILHPGVAVALRRLGSDELGIARLMMEGEIASPQRYKHIHLLKIRITGTGVAYRAQHREWTFRDPALYCTPDFIARCSGLPVVWEHPEKAILDAKEFENRIVGTVFMAFIDGDEVWAIAKVWNNEAADLLADGELSTSPGVLLGPSDGERIETDNGDVLLIEGKPELVDHIAVGVPLGVWDKYGPPSGVKVDAAPDPRIDRVIDRARWTLINDSAARLAR